MGIQCGNWKGLASGVVSRSIRIEFVSEDFVRENRMKSLACLNGLNRFDFQKIEEPAYTVEIYSGKTLEVEGEESTVLDIALTKLSRSSPKNYIRKLGSSTARNRPL